MDRRSTSELTKSQKRKIDKLLEKKLQSPALRRKFCKRVNVHDVLEGMRNTVPIRTVQEIQQIQQNKGRVAAASKLLDEVCRYDCWATALLDALHSSLQVDFAKELYPSYVPPANDDDDDDDSQDPRGPPPEYNETDENLQKIPDETYPKTSSVIEQDQVEEYARLRAKHNIRSSDESPINPNPASVAQCSVEPAVPVTCPAASLYQDSCAEQSDNTARVRHEAGNVEGNIATEQQLNVLEASRGLTHNTVSMNDPDSRLSADNYGIDDPSKKYAKERELNFKSFSKEESNPSTSDTIAGLSVRNDNGKVMDQKLLSVARHNTDDNKHSDYLSTVDFSANESCRPLTHYADSDIGKSESSQSVSCNPTQNVDEQTAEPNTSEQTAEPNTSEPVDHENVDDESISSGNEPKKDSSNVCVSDTRELNSDDDTCSDCEDPCDHETRSYESTEQSTNIDQNTLQSSHHHTVVAVRDLLSDSAGDEPKENERNAASDYVADASASSNVQHDGDLESPTLSNAILTEPTQKSDSEYRSADANPPATAPLDAGDNDTRVAVEEDRIDLPLTKTMGRPNVNVESDAIKFSCHDTRSDLNSPDQQQSVRSVTTNSEISWTIADEKKYSEKSPSSNSVDPSHSDSPHQTSSTNDEVDAIEVEKNNESLSNNINHAAQQSQNKPKTKNTEEQTMAIEKINPKRPQDQSYVESDSDLTCNVVRNRFIGRLSRIGSVFLYFNTFDDKYLQK